MISFVKSVAVLSAVCLAVSAWAAKNDDSSTPKPDSKESGKKKGKKKDADQQKIAGQPATPAPKKTYDVPVEKGHDSYGMSIPYFDTSGKRQMNFKIGVASRLDEDHIRMKDLNIETFNEQSGEHEMDIYMPTAVFNTATSWVTSKQHVTIKRDDFEISGEALAFNTETKQGGLGGNVTMIIYNLEEETDSKVKADEAKKLEDAKDKAAAKEKAAASQPIQVIAPSISISTPKPTANTPRTKAK
jgi:hypothetical protein